MVKVMAIQKVISGVSKAAKKIIGKKTNTSASVFDSGRTTKNKGKEIFKVTLGFTGIGALFYSANCIGNKAKNHSLLNSTVEEADTVATTAEYDSILRAKSENEKKMRQQMENGNHVQTNLKESVAEDWEIKISKALNKDKAAENTTKDTVVNNEYTEEEKAKIEADKKRINSKSVYDKSIKEQVEYYDSQVIRPRYKKAEEKNNDKNIPAVKSKKENRTKEPVKKTETANIRKKEQVKANPQNNKPAAVIKPNNTKAHQSQTQQELITVKKGDCVWNIIKKDLKRNPEKYKTIADNLAKKLGKQPTRNQIINQVNIWTCKENNIGNIIKPGTKIKISINPPNK